MESTTSRYARMPLQAKNTGLPRERRACKQKDKTGEIEAAAMSGEWGYEFVPWDLQAGSGKQANLSHQCHYGRSGPVDMDWRARVD